ncbi:MAG: general secretion pathway protein GspK [Myxococcales bacterium]|nr:general secretion pathway protein GspK [Myxococcales bacterium]MCB9576395.1 general secretion pathway protein GspK [Polyangiaceae bacterium]
MALILVLSSLTILAVMLAEFQDETAAEMGSALSTRDSLKAEYAARSAVNLSRLLIASEPTIRKALAPLFLLMKQGPPQIPVWEFADQVLGAFNSEEGNESFKLLAGVDIADGKNLGMEGAGFDVKVVDEDSKINLNVAARGDAFSQARLAEQLIGLMANPTYDKMFENRDADGQFSDRQTICAAVVDWVDPDQDAYVCDPHSGTAQQAGAEDSFYQLLKKPYSRKNAAFDSLAELHLIRGVSDDFWSTFVDPDPDSPDKRVVTVWGQGKINVNTANGQTILAIVCGGATPGTPLCTDPTMQATFLSAMTMAKGFTMGAPLFSSPKAFINAVKGKGMVGTMLAALNVKPVTLLSETETMKAVATQSKVFSVYATGVVKAGKRETRVRVHAVIDFRGAPPPGAPPGTPGVDEALENQPTTGGTATGGQSQTPSNLPDGATEAAIAAAFQPSPGGNIIYYRID